MEYYICTDVGGTNMTTGLFTINTQSLIPDFDLLEHKSYKSQELPNIIHGLKDAIPYFMNKYSIPQIPPINISACGPTNGLTCQPTNLPAPNWLIDKREIENYFNTIVFLINDFEGVVYGLMTLKDKDSKVVHIAPSPMSDFSHTKESIKVGLGAGTGLGCATIHHKNNLSTLIPSEAGWLDFAPDAHNPHETAFMHYLAARTPDGTMQLKDRNPATSWEDAISGSRGIAYIYDFFCNKEYSQNLISDEGRTQLKKISDACSRKTIPQKISSLAKENNIHAKQVMTFWITLYARYTKQIALTKLPYGGIFLGGGAGAKNIEFFLEDNLFYRTFIAHNNGDIKQLLEKIPLYMIIDYHISLYGNAYHLYKNLENSPHPHHNRS